MSPSSCLAMPSMVLRSSRRRRTVSRKLRFSLRRAAISSPRSVCDLRALCMVTRPPSPTSTSPSKTRITRATTRRITLLLRRGRRRGAGRRSSGNPRGWCDRRLRLTSLDGTVRVLSSPLQPGTSFRVVAESLDDELAKWQILLESAYLAPPKEIAREVPDVQRGGCGRRPGHVT